MARALILIEDNPDGTLRIEMAHDGKGRKSIPATKLAFKLFRFADEETAPAPSKEGEPT